ncbi:MAG: hypothetical protein FWC89_05630 [Defluviitaleaceae bacterium]|nr:hypothetical protein [Defluviitaleaceae bacterium]
MMKSVFVLQHSYESDCCSCDETKFIGVYSTEAKAHETVERLKNVTGFCNHPVECFQIDEYELDVDHWVEGFVREYWSVE